ncbi:MAG TPA: substrate-binding domain-containing protein [Caulifigura sp.]|jgi:molybdenum ABC transporter molybdate-binding protein|nr:substrate-binding domain-containing protein [Caulifigura sp.]
MKSVGVIFVASLVVLGALTWLLLSSSAPPAPGVANPATGDTGSPVATSGEPITVFVAASNRGVFEAIRKDYEAAYHTPIEVQYGPSQTLLSSMEVSGTGDLYLPADDSYLDIAAQKGLIKERLPLAVMKGVAVVPKGNPKKLQTLADLERDGIKLVQADPDAAAIGKVTREALSADQKWEALKARTTAFKTTVNDVANDVKIGSADVGIIYDAVAASYPELEIVRIPELDKVHGDVEVAVTASTKQPRRALHLARYIAAADKGLVKYKEFGFAPVEGDVWGESPEVLVYAGSMLRPAVEETFKAFEEREGIKLTRVYNGCGILVAQMKTGERPDAYFACDSEFMNEVQDLFQPRANVAQNELVILVPKGNKHAIGSLKDLTKPGLKVGVGHEKQCAMGWLTQRTLVEGGVKDEVMSNVTVQTPTGDMLVNQLKAGSLDAAVAYISNAAGSSDTLDAIRIQGLQCSIAVQPLAVSKGTKHPQLMGRLAERLKSAESKTQFLSFGFSWKGDEPVFGGVAPSESTPQDTTAKEEQK